MGDGSASSPSGTAAAIAASPGARQAQETMAFVPLWEPEDGILEGLGHLGIVSEKRLDALGDGLLRYGDAHVRDAVAQAALARVQVLNVVLAHEAHYPLVQRILGAATLLERVLQLADGRVQLEPDADVVLELVQRDGIGRHRHCRCGWRR